MAKEKFEDRMNRLTDIVDLLEKGEVELDESISLYEEGLKLSKALKKELNSFEQKIKILSEEEDDE